jgi:uncharacterized protein YlxW (UPF0749 family)
MTGHQHRESWRHRLVEAVSARTRAYATRTSGWRALVPVVFLLAGALFVTSAVSSGGKDLRAGGYQDLAGLVNDQAHHVEALRARASDLSNQVNRLSKSLGTGTVAGAQGKADALRGAAGLEPARGTGLTITLNDAPAEIQRTADVDVANLIVHQQDIQAVANALWAGGATAMTIQGQRVVSTTGIKCVGNTVVLHDVPYAPPYVISAVGPTDQMSAAVDASAYIKLYKLAVDRYELGWDEKTETDLHLPAYTGPTELRYARPAGNSGGNPNNRT